MVCLLPTPKNAPSSCREKYQYGTYTETKKNITTCNTHELLTRKEHTTIMSITYTSGINYQNTPYEYSSKSTAKTANTSGNFSNHLEESAVDNFKKRHPDRAHHVDKQVRAGQSFLGKNGLDRSLTEKMTMDEYQAYIYALIDRIPYDYTRQNDTTVVSISPKGWEQVRNDPKYEAWVIGYLVEDRSIRNPFYEW